LLVVGVLHQAPSLSGIRQGINCLAL
jgi:hypothetical protein